MIGIKSDSVNTDDLMLQNRHAPEVDGRKTDNLMKSV